MIGKHVAGLLDLKAQELPADGRYTAADDARLGCRGDLVDDDCDAAVLALAAYELHGGVSVGDTRGLGRADDQHIVGGGRDLDDVPGDAGAGVDDHEVGLALEDLHLRDEPHAVLVGQVGKIGYAARAGDKLDPVGRAHGDVVQALSAGDDLGQPGGRRDPGEHVEVGEPEVSVDEHDTAPGASGRDGEVEGDVGLADPALAARDGHYPRAPARRRDDLTKP